MENSFEELKSYILSHTEDMVELEALLTAIPALAPENGGDGEFEKAAALEKWLCAHGIKEISRYDAPDERVSSKCRPNMVAKIPGADDGALDSYCIWVCAHLDVVPVGEKSLWNTDPWTLVEKDGKIYGRGVEDNQQGLASGILAALAFVATGTLPAHTIKLLFMADEEVGSKYGMNYLLEKHRELFGKSDRILIPDGGDSAGATIEIAEKNILWPRFHTIGKQSHGSRPDLGRNACLAAADLALRINSLEQTFNGRNELFDPPTSTFQPTMKFQNVEGVNMIPGDDVLYADCRINPDYPLSEVRAEIKKHVEAVEQKYGVKIEVSEVQAEESKATPKDAPVVRELAAAIKAVHGIEAKTVGIGGGTVAAGLRNLGFDAVVWSTLDETCHQPNEYAIVENISKDALTVAYMASA